MNKRAMRGVMIMFAVLLSYLLLWKYVMFKYAIGTLFAMCYIGSSLIIGLGTYVDYTADEDDEYY